MKRQLILLVVLLILVGVFFVDRIGKSASRPQSLYDACVDGNMDAVRDFLSDEDTDVNAPDKNGATPLHVAVVRNNPLLVRLLLKHDANVNAKTNSGWVPLMDAAHRGYFSCMKILIENGADVNTKTKKGWTALMHLCHYGKPGIYRRQAVKLLIENGADIKTKNNGDWTAFMHLFYDPGAGEDGPILSKLFIEHGAEVNAKNDILWTPFMYAVRYGENSDAKLQTITFLIKKGADVNAKNKSRWIPLMHAVNSGSAGKGKIALVKLLIQSGAAVNAVNKHEQSAIFYARDEQTLSLLLDNGAKIEARNKKKRTPMMHAIANGRTEVAKGLIKRGCKINPVDKYGYTALILAAKQNHGEVMELLLHEGADVKTKNKYGRTALFYASKKGSADLITTLIKKGSPINEKTGYYDWTPLSYACRWGNYDAVKVLVEKGAELNHYTSEGWTPLMYAVNGGFVPIVELLKKHNPDFEREMKILNENAAPFYIRAMAKGFYAKRKLRDKIDTIIRAGWKKDKDIDEYLEDTKMAFKLLMEGVKRERCDFDYFPKDEKSWKVRVNFLSYKIEEPCRFFLLKGRQLQFQNRYPEAVESYLSFLNFLQHIGGLELVGFKRASLDSVDKQLAAIREYLDTTNGSPGTAAKHPELCRKINRRLEAFKKELFSAVSLVESEKEFLLGKLEYFARHMKEFEQEDDPSKPQTAEDKASTKFFRDLLHQVVDEIVVKEGKQLADQYCQYYKKAARSNRDEDWRAADARVEKLAATLQKNEKGEFVFPVFIDKKLMEKVSKEGLEEDFREIVKALIARGITGKFKKYVSLYYKNLRTIDDIQTRL